MSEYASKSIASIIQPPSGETVVDHTTIVRSLRSKDVGFVAIGLISRYQQEVQPDEHGIAYVGMNDSGRLEILDNQDALIATSSLAGCTGIAGFAKRSDGSIATFISHYDPISQSAWFTGEDSPANKDLYSFKYQVRENDVDSPISYVVAYPDIEHHNPEHGKRRGAFKDWSYLDQIEVTSAQLGNTSEVLLLPYDMGNGHTLASGKIDGHEGIFWDGIPVKFDDYLNN